MSKFEYDMWKYLKEEERKEYEKYDKKTTAGANFLELLLLVFIVLKLCKVITWSWWWVLSPLWISIVLVILIVIIVTILDKFDKF